MTPEIIWEGQPAQGWVVTQGQRVQLGLSLAALAVAVPFFISLLFSGTPIHVVLCSVVVIIHALCIGPISLWLDRRRRRQTHYRLSKDGLVTRRDTRTQEVASNHALDLFIEPHPGGHGSVWSRPSGSTEKPTRLLESVSRPLEVKAVVVEAFNTEDLDA